MVGKTPNSSLIFSMLYMLSNQKLDHPLNEYDTSDNLQDEKTLGFPRASMQENTKVVSRENVQTLDMHSFPIFCSIPVEAIIKSILHIDENVLNAPSQGWVMCRISSDRLDSHGRMRHVLHMEMHR